MHEGVVSKLPQGVANAQMFRRIFLPSAADSLRSTVIDVRLSRSDISTPTNTTLKFTV